MADDASSKKFLVSNFNNYKMVDSRLVMENFNELLRTLRQYTQPGLKIDESISISSVIDKLPPSWKDFKNTLKHGKDDLSLVQLGSHLRIKESLRAQESNKGKGKEVAGASVNMTDEGGKNKNKKQNKGKKHSFNKNDGSSGSNKKPKMECWKCGKTSHFKRDCRSGNKKNNAIAGGSGKGSKDQSQDQGFGYYNSGMFILNLNKFPDDSCSVYMSSSTIVNSSLWQARLEHVNYKRMLEMSKDDLIHTIDENTEKCTTCMLHHLWAIKRIIHENKASYTPQQYGVAEKKNSALKEMVNSMLSYSGLSEGFWGEAMLTACYLLIRAVVRLPDPKRKTLGEKGINCIFVGYAEHSNAYSYIWLRDQEIKLDHNTLTVKVLRRILEPIIKLCNLEMLLS
ncbi:zinc finger, CCHC-type containing protein [Tanacetum coccineum]